MRKYRAQIEFYEQKLHSDICPRLPALVNVLWKLIDDLKKKKNAIDVAFRTFDTEMIC